MNVLYLAAALGLMAITNCHPMPQSQPSVVPGVFISADALKNLQDRANGNANGGYQPNTNAQNLQPNPNQVYQPNTNVPNSQPITNPGYQPNTNLPNSQPISNQGYQPNTMVQNPQPISNQVYQPISNTPNPQPTYQPVNSNPPQNYQPANNQPGLTAQPVVNQPATNNQVQPVVGARIPDTNSNQLNLQPSQPVIYVQQPLPNQPTIFTPPTNQPAQPSVVLNPQPNQGLVFQNGQPTMIITNPSNGNQIQGTNPSTVYTLIPLNGQNSNSNSGSYLIPIQPGDSNPVVLSTGH